jgi:hypothetical protein
MHERPAPRTNTLRKAAAPRAWPGCSWARWVWFRVALLVLLLATPGIGDTLQEVVEYATGIECCEGGACDDGGVTGGCSHACTHCACCAHPRALPTDFQLLGLTPGESAQTHIGGSENGLSSGYRAPPFRPPVG